MNRTNVLLLLLLIMFIILVVVSIKNIASRSFNEGFGDFASTKASQVNMRSGPSLEYPIIFTYYHRGIPLQILDHYQHWYKVKDAFNHQGWIISSLLSAQETALVIKEQTALYKNQHVSETPLAYISKYHIVYILNCNTINVFCAVKVKIPDDKFFLKGWIKKKHLWGPNNLEN